MDNHRGSLPRVLSDLIRQAVTEQYDIDGNEVPVSVTRPPDPEFGDLSSAIGLALAKRLRTNPMQIAGQLKTSLDSLVPGVVDRITVTPPGYVNFFLQPIKTISALSDGLYIRPQLDRIKDIDIDMSYRVCIEHTNINPNKAAHIGHLRNACLGDCVARLLRLAGLAVEVQNYIDDTGTAVADIVVGLQELNAKCKDGKRYDDFCWDLYTKVHNEYERVAEFADHRRRVLGQIEDASSETSALARDVSQRIVKYHLDTMKSLGVDYDLLTWESHILQLKFWENCFDMLADKGVLTRADSGDNEGCWVVELGDNPEFGKLENPDKVLVRSDGTATYTAKDIAYQLWKFGLLGQDFRYELYSKQWTGRDLWTTTVDGVDDHPQFGSADVVINVIDVRQSYLQDILTACLDQLGFKRAADHSIHFNYEVVVLSEDAARELGIDSGSSVAMSGRKGIGVKAHELIATAEDLARTEVKSRHADWDDDQINYTARSIAAAAIRYYMLRFKTTAQLAFDFKDALSMTGKTGPYLQYGYARAERLLEKADEPGVMSEADVTDAERKLIVLMAVCARRLEEAAETLELTPIAEHAHDMVSSFMAFYEAAPVLKAPLGVRDRRLAVVSEFHELLGIMLDVLGIERLQEM